MFLTSLFSYNWLLVGTWRDFHSTWFRCSGPTSHWGTLWARGSVSMVSTPTFCWWMMEHWENMAASKASGRSWRNTSNYRRYTLVSQCVCLCVFVPYIQEVRNSLSHSSPLLQDWTKECLSCVWWWREALLLCPQCWTMLAMCPLCRCWCSRARAGLLTCSPSYTSRLLLTGMHAYLSASTAVDLMDPPSCVKWNHMFFVIPYVTTLMSRHATNITFMFTAF